MIMKKEKRLYSLDFLKIFACLCVIMNHVIEFIKDYANHSFSGALFYSVNFSIYKCAVPIFIMTTGVLLLRKKISYREMVKKIIRIFIPLLILSFIIYIKENQTTFSFYTFLELFFKDPIKVPYWYLYMLIVLYLMVPFIQKMIQEFKDNDYKYFIFMVLLLPGLLNIISVYSPISFSQSFFMAWIPIYLGYFVGGYYLYQISLKKKDFYFSILIFLISTILLGLSMFLPFIYKGELAFVLDNTSNLFVMLASLSIFYIARYLIEPKTMNQMLARIISFFSSTTFGIYLIHFLVYYMVYFRTPFIYDKSPELGVITTTLLTFIICSGITALGKKIPLIKNFL